MYPAKHSILIFLIFIKRKKKTSIKVAILRAILYTKD